MNHNRPAKLVALAEEAVGNLDGAEVAVLGLAFKPDTDDLRDSPALALIEVLQRRGARVRGYDPFIPALPRQGVKLCGSAADALTGADVAIIASALPELRTLDWSALADRMKYPIVIDGRNALRRVPLPPTLMYLPIGRHFKRMALVERKG